MFSYDMESFCEGNKTDFTEKRDKTERIEPASTFEAGPLVTERFFL